jgi:hypothetical protein
VSGPGTFRGSLDQTVLIIGCGLALVLVAGFLVLTLAGRGTDGYVLFVSGPLVTSIVGSLLSRRVSAVESLARDALSATASMVPAQLLIDASRSASGSASAVGAPVAAPTADLVSPRVG